MKETIGVECLGADYLRPPPLPVGALARSYRRQTKAEREEERQAVGHQANLGLMNESLGYLPLGISVWQTPREFVN